MPPVRRARPHITNRAGFSPSSPTHARQTPTSCYRYVWAGVLVAALLYFILRDGGSESARILKTYSGNSLAALGSLTESIPVDFEKIEREEKISKDLVEKHDDEPQSDHDVHDEEDAVAHDTHDLVTGILTDEQKSVAQDHDETANAESSETASSGEEPDDITASEPEKVENEHVDNEPIDDHPSLETPQESEKISEEVHEEADENDEPHPPEEEAPEADKEEDKAEVGNEVAEVTQAEDAEGALAVEHHELPDETEPEKDDHAHADDENAHDVEVEEEEEEEEEDEETDVGPAKLDKYSKDDLEEMGFGKFLYAYRVVAPYVAVRTKPSPIGGLQGLLASNKKITMGLTKDSHKQGEVVVGYKVAKVFGLWLKVAPHTWMPIIKKDGPNVGFHAVLKQIRKISIPGNFKKYWRMRRLPCSQTYKTESARQTCSEKNMIRDGVLNVMRKMKLMSDEQDPDIHPFPNNHLPVKHAKKLRQVQQQQDVHEV